MLRRYVQGSLTELGPGQARHLPWPLGLESCLEREPRQRGSPRFIILYLFYTYNSQKGFYVGQARWLHPFAIFPNLPLCGAV